MGGSKIYMRSISFPDPDFADADGLLAIGGNFEPQTLISAYSQGIFPWTSSPITWWSPDPRGIFEIENFKLKKRMQRLYNQKKFNITFDKSFKNLMIACSEPGPGRGETWITDEFIKAYCNLNKLGWAHSVEAWYDGELVGGLYGVVIAGLFAGESMFYRKSNASTMALAFLIEHLKEKKFVLFDTQMVTNHTKRLGAVEISRSEYLKRLAVALKSDCKF